MSTQAWRRTADAQDRVLARRQALACGVSADTWDRRLATGRWQRLLPGVASTHDGGITARERSWAPVLYAGPGAHLSGDAALRLHGMVLDEPWTYDVVVPAARVVTAQTSSRHLLRVRVHRSGDLAVQRQRGCVLPVVRMPVALVHSAAWAPSDAAAEWRIAAAVQQRLVRPEQVRRELQHHPNLRRRQLVREVLDDVELGAHAASELAFLRFLRRFRLPRPDVLQRPVRLGGLCYLDARWERRRVSVEVDGAHHRFVGQWEADLLRAGRLALASRDRGELLLRFTTGNLRNDAEQVRRLLAAALL